MISNMDEIEARAATMADLSAFAALLAAAEQHDIGEVFTDIEDLEAGWRAPGFEFGRDTMLMYGGGELVAAAMVYGARADAAVMPSYRGRGLGNRLMAWTEVAAQGELIGQSVVDTLGEARILFEKRRYEPLYSSWVLRYRPHRSIPDSPPPEGIVIRPARASELPAAYRVIEDAFNEWPHRTPSTWEEWKADTTDRPDFDGSLFRVALDGDLVVGAIFGIRYPAEGWVDQLAVAEAYRRRGIARALLSSIFQEFRTRGQALVGLNTDSRTGALDVYLGLGMEPERTFVHYSKRLRDG